MTNLVTYSDFTNRNRLANAQTNQDVQDYLTGLITDGQYDFLNQLLGPVLYPQFVTWYTAGQASSDPFFGLLNGFTFVYSGTTYQWVGLKKPITNFVYYLYQKLDATQTVSGGEAKSKSQNAIRATSVYKMCQQWNQMAYWMPAFLAYMDLFYGTTGTVSYSVPLPFYKDPITVQVGVSTGITAGSSTFTYDGTLGTPDWRGYEAYPERISQGTLVKGVNYTWNSTTAVFVLIANTFQPLEYFNFTFSLGNPSYFNLVANTNWGDYRPKFLCTELTKTINSFGI